ncbi:family 76 putative glycoside hydrolase [Cladorrhinum sp. PSN259]|nr:family 76 putative glycoside hydrolase [Cladorrhinum sp. PSN259]
MRIRWAAVVASASIASAADIPVFDEMLAALAVLQNSYYAHWLGTWPEGNDWTRAVTGTYVAGALRTIAQDMEALPPNATRSRPSYQNLVTRHFEELIGYYFGQDAFSIRNQAFDDMLWVVLGWLETIQYINQQNEGASARDWEWHGRGWVPAFAHRARVFWELASRGWDQKYCGGGMNWNPKLLPYKNAITNELFIAASINMYQHFPGDRNSSPWDFKNGHDRFDPTIHLRQETFPPKAPLFLYAAQMGYEWLESSGMMNDEGLYTDGFHISGISEGNNNTKCDKRDDMLYTYNQGVILTGQLGLYVESGEEKYLNDGHQLIRNLIKATGWDLKRQQPMDSLSKLKPGYLPPWRGLGRGGVLEEACDISAGCSQDSQTFKGIWMYHFTTFCEPASLKRLAARATTKLGGRDEAKKIRERHYGKCKEYVPWLRHNVKAALGTKDGHGKFGMWWTAGLIDVTTSNMVLNTPGVMPPDLGEDDYRNHGVPTDNRNWVAMVLPRNNTLITSEKQGFRYDGYDAGRRGLEKREDLEESVREDPNSRGRGRTGETQGGGLALLRALWAVSKHEGA